MQRLEAPVRAVRVGRFQFIDFARGIVMAIMAWDHISGFWNRYHGGGEGLMGNAPQFANFVWFLARFVSHYCAPTFVFLAGTVLAISTAKRLGRGESQWDISRRMIIRGVTLLLFEAFVVAPAFGTSSFYFGVIACIGVSFIIFSVLRRLPQNAILALSILIVLNHPYLRLDWIPDDTWWGWYARVIIHEPGRHPDFAPFTGLYPVIPWLGVMGVGWAFGLFLSELDMSRVRELKAPLLRVGVASLLLWFVVRLANGYGNLLQRQGDSLMEWLYVSKYPPSLAFLLWTLGGMCLFMALGLQLQERPNFGTGMTGFILVLGRNPLFFYLTHLWLYRMRLPGTMRPFTLPLIPTLVFWAVGLFVLWKLCVRYEALKRRHPNSLLQYI